MTMHPNAKKMWWEAYLAGIVSGDQPDEAVTTAAIAIEDYTNKWNAEPEPDADQAYTGWAHVELMGHRDHYGCVREVRMYGARLLEIQVLDDVGELTKTKRYGGGAIYCIHEMTESECKRAATAYPRDTDPIEEEPADDSKSIF